MATQFGLHEQVFDVDSDKTVFPNMLQNNYGFFSLQPLAKKCRELTEGVFPTLVHKRDYYSFD